MKKSLMVVAVLMAQVPPLCRTQELGPVDMHDRLCVRGGRGRAAVDVAAHPEGCGAGIHPGGHACG